MEVKYVPSSEITPLGTLEEVEAWHETLFGHLASILHIRRAKLNAKDKQAFRDYWYGHKKVYTK